MYHALRLEALQNRALRIVTGQLVLTPIKPLRLETDVPSYSTTSNRLILRSRKKVYEVLTTIQTERPWTTTYHNAYSHDHTGEEKLNDLATALPGDLQHHQPLELFTIAPWHSDI